MQNIARGENIITRDLVSSSAAVSDRRSPPGYVRILTLSRAQKCDWHECTRRTVQIKVRVCVHSRENVLLQLPSKLRQGTGRFAINFPQTHRCEEAVDEVGGWLVSRERTVARLLRFATYSSIPEVCARGWS